MACSAVIDQQELVSIEQCAETSTSDATHVSYSVFDVNTASLGLDSTSEGRERRVGT